MSSKLRIGEIKYANCVPLYHTIKNSIDCTGYDFFPGVPATLNRLLAEGGIDISSSSSIEYARHADDYLIIPELSISSDGRVMSILLISRLPVEELDGTSIAVSSASATSTVLLKVLLKFHYHVDSTLAPHRPVLSEMLADHPAALLIGDDALREHADLSQGHGLHVYDLGLVWKEFSGLPFVYALWMIREDSARRLPELAARFKRDIVTAKKIAQSDFGRIAKENPVDWMSADGLIDYWNAVSYCLKPAHIDGLTRFYQLAYDVGEIPEIPHLRFL